MKIELLLQNCGPEAREGNESEFYSIWVPARLRACAFLYG